MDASNIVDDYVDTHDLEVSGAVGLGLTPRILRL